jgi:3D-(3,5/4)-trihydroxycyclohexane-1,2-dione acylhydrolase (decyclizing)
VTTVRLTAAEAVVRHLAAQWSTRDGVPRRAIPAMFGIFGHGNVNGLGHALADPAAGMEFHQPKNEQAMVHAALGYAKASRRLATLACTSSIGPGATNLVTGAATATTNRLPVLLLPADTFANRRQGTVLQQLEHPSYADWTANDCLRPVSRFFDRIARPEQLLTALPEAMRVLLDPAETGAVTIALHQDVQAESHDFPAVFFERRTWHVRRPAPEPQAIAAAAGLLRDAQRPLIVAGGGVRYSEAEAALAALADGCGIPVAETSAGKALYDGEHAVGGIGVNGARSANAIAERADVVLCVGTRLSDFTTASRSLFQAADVRFAAINVVAADAHRLGAVAVVADARAALEALHAALGDSTTPEGYRREVEQARASWREALAADLAPRTARMSQGQALRAINAATRAGDWVVAAAGSPPGDLLKTWHAPSGSSVHIEFAYSCMGHEIPAGLGIRMADPSAGEVLVVIGDGTYLMAPTELVTAVQEQLKLTVVILVNGGYQSIHALQRGTSGDSFGNEFRAPDGSWLAVDYAANAASMGCATWRVATAAGLAAALEAARTETRAAVIVCDVDPGRTLLSSGAWWDVGVQDAVGAARQRWHG